MHRQLIISPFDKIQLLKDMLDNINIIELLTPFLSNVGIVCGGVLALRFISNTPVVCDTFYISKNEMTNRWKIPFRMWGH